MKVTQTQSQLSWCFQSGQGNGKHRQITRELSRGYCQKFTVMAPNSVREGWFPGAQQRYCAQEFSSLRENKEKDHTANSKRLGVAGIGSTRQARTTACVAESHTNPFLEGPAGQIKKSGHNRRATESR